MAAHYGGRIRSGPFNAGQLGLAQRRDGGVKLDARELADRLRMFGVRPATLRLGDDAFARGYRREDLRDAFDRYLTDVTSHVTAA